MQFFKISNWAMLISLLSILLASELLPVSVEAEQASMPGWKYTGFAAPYRLFGTTTPNTASRACIDGTQPDTLLFPITDAKSGAIGTYRYNWVTNQQIKFSDWTFSSCNEESGLLFAPYFSYGLASTRYSQNEPSGQHIQYLPDQLASDGSQLVYSLESDASGKKFVVSSDGGLNWQERGKLFGNKAASFAIGSSAARSVYMLTLDNDNSQGATYSLYYSGDAGTNWEKRANLATPPRSISTASITTLSGNASPAGSLIFSHIDEQNDYKIQTILYSADGGRNFSEVARNKIANSRASFYQTSEGLLRFSLNLEAQKYALELSGDNGKSWQNLALPYDLPFPENFNFANPAGEAIIRQPKNSPTNLFLANSDGKGDLWYSPNGGKNWQKLGENMEEVLFTPYSPLTVLGLKNKRLYSLDLPEADKSQTKGVTARGSADNLFFGETGHNLSGLIRQYWEKNGGVPQFGYPKTEAFREINSADGKVYQVQYFERNRFEYHPENSGTPYEVLLGLLGNQLTEERRIKNEAAFKRVAQPAEQNLLYFSETGHSLQAEFRQYWEKNGGVALYGYPISEQFQEVNPDNGKVYQVQYFERNRFELHPENAGTPYEVLLGLLGNSLLKIKGWQ